MSHFDKDAEPRKTTPELIGRACHIHLPGETKDATVVSRDSVSYRLRANDGTYAFSVGARVVESKFAENDPYFYAC